MEVQLIKGHKDDCSNKKVNTDKLIRVAAYIRVSTDHEDQLSSLDNQRKYYERKINKNENWELVNIYSDEGISGTRDTARPGFIKMIKDACNEKIDLIITKSVSRFARNTVDTLNYVRMLSDKGVYINFEEEGINTMTMDSELLLTVLSAVAQQESKNLSEHVSKGHLMKIQRGEHVGTLKCYGYDYNKEDKQIYINKEEAEVVKKIFDLYLKGNGTLAIARILTNEGIPNIQGGSIWREESITHIIMNEKYTGDLILGKYYVKNHLTHQSKKNNGERDKYLIRDHHEAIIDKDTFNKVQEIREERRKKRCHMGYSSQSRYAFSGKFKCGFCGSSMRRCKTNNRINKARYSCTFGLGYTVYKCENSKMQGEEILKKAFMQAANRLRNKIKLEHRFSDRENKKISYARKILLNKNIDIEKFDSDLFEELIKIAILGDIDENGKIQPYTVRFIIKTEINPFVEQSTKGKIDLEKINTTNILDFYSNQMWQDYDKNGRVRYNNRFRVLVDYDNEED